MARQNLCDQVVQQIQSEIVSGALKNGEKLPSEFELAEKYSVSRFTIREAVKKLTSMGLVSVRHGVGSFINIISPQSYLKPLLPSIILSDQDIKSACEARLAIETKTVSLCVGRITSQELTQLKDLCVKMEQAIQSSNNQQYNQYDLEFHLLIAKASRNQILYDILDALKDILAIQMNRTVEAPNSVRRSMRRHYQLVGFIEDGEATLAEDIMKLHMEDSINYLGGKAT